MSTRGILKIASCLWLGYSALVPAETASPERVQIISINGRALGSHPAVINVLPGEQVSFKADVLQYGNACPNPEGCPEGREAEPFSWSTDMTEARNQFQPAGTEMIFHIPYAMGRNITLQVSHEGLSSGDTIILHNARFADDNRGDVHSYPVLAPAGIDSPYWGPYYPYAYCWSPYSYNQWNWCGPGGMGWAVGVNWTVGVSWGFWGWPYWGWYGGYYHPGFYGYYHPGWWGPRYAFVSGQRPWYAPAARFNSRVGAPFAARPMGYEGPPSRGSFFRRRGR